MNDTGLDGSEARTLAPPLERLFLMWLRAADLTPSAFLARLKLPKASLLKATGGWLKKRQLARRGEFRPFESPVARLKVAVLWWELVARLGEELEAPRACETELKRLAALAAILKAAQAGLNQVGAFDGAGAECASPIFEGLDVERL